MFIHHLSFDNHTNGIQTFIFQDIFLTIASRSDADLLTEKNYVNHPACYVLYSDFTQYVGQSANTKNGVITRIKSHQTTKDWWDTILFFGYTDPTKLTKSATDYLERILISRLKQHGITLTNKTDGNKSNCDSHTKQEMERMLQTVFFILENFTKLEILKPQTYETDIHNYTLHMLDTYLANPLHSLDDILTKTNLLTLTKTNYLVEPPYYLKEDSTQFYLSQLANLKEN